MSIRIGCEFAFFSNLGTLYMLCHGTMFDIISSVRVRFTLKKAHRRRTISGRRIVSLMGGYSVTSSSRNLCMLENLQILCEKHVC